MQHNRAGYAPRHAVPPAHIPEPLDCVFILLAEYAPRHAVSPTHIAGPLDCVFILETESTTRDLYLVGKKKKKDLYFLHDIDMQPVFIL